MPKRYRKWAWVSIIPSKERRCRVRTASSLYLPTSFLTIASLSTVFGQTIRLECGAVLFVPVSSTHVVMGGAMKMGSLQFGGWQDRQPQMSSQSSYLASVHQLASFQTASASPMVWNAPSHESCKTALIGKKTTLQFKVVIHRIAQMTKMNL